MLTPCRQRQFHRSVACLVVTGFGWSYAVNTFCRAHQAAGRSCILSLHWDDVAGDKFLSRAPLFRAANVTTQLLAMNLSGAGKSCSCEGPNSSDKLGT